MTEGEGRRGEEEKSSMEERNNCAARSLSVEGTDTSARKAVTPKSILPTQRATSVDGSSVLGLKS